MKSLLTTAIAGLMLLGLFSAVATPNPNHAKKNAPVVMGDIGPLPTCMPGVHGCK